jgi:alpha-mannosidase
VEFHLGSTEPGAKNAVVARGQTIPLPAGYDRLYLLAASSSGDRRATLHVGDRPVELAIQDWSGFVGQWDTRRWKRIQLPAEEAAGWAQLASQARTQLEAEGAEVRAAGGDTVMAWAGVDRNKRLLERHLASLELAYDGITPGFLKPAPIAWYASHRHDRSGNNEAYRYSYLFGQEIGLAPGTTSITLPDDPRIRILALTVARAGPTLTPAWPLFDRLPESPGGGR